VPSVSAALGLCGIPDKPRFSNRSTYAWTALKMVSIRRWPSGVSATSRSIFASVSSEAGRCIVRAIVGRVTNADVANAGPPGVASYGLKKFSRPFLKTDRLSDSERAMLMGGLFAKAYRWSTKKFASDSHNGSRGPIATAPPRYRWRHGHRSR